MSLEHPFVLENKEMLKERQICQNDTEASKETLPDQIWNKPRIKINNVTTRL